MVLRELPREIWLLIFQNVKNPLPPLSRPCTRQHYHQQDLVNLIRVNGLFNSVAAEILYDHPVVDDPSAFLRGLLKQQSSPKHRVSLTKSQLLQHVTFLELLHQNSISTRMEKPFLDFKDSTNKNDKEAELDITSLAGASNLINQCKAMNLQILPNVEAIRIGAYEGQWWSDKSYTENRSPWPSEPLNDQQKYLEAYSFTHTLLESTQPGKLCIHITRGPLAMSVDAPRDCKAFYEKGSFTPPLHPQHFVYHLNVDELEGSSKRTDYPKVILGVRNQWHLSISKDTASKILMKDLYHYIARLVGCTELYQENIHSDTTTTLEVFGGELLLSQIKQEHQRVFSRYLQEKLRSSYLELGDDPMGIFSSDAMENDFPSRATPTKEKTKRYGPFGLIEEVELQIQYEPYQPIEIR